MSIGNLAKATVITLALLMASVSLMATQVQPTKAQTVQEGGSLRLPAGVTPDYRVATSAFLSFRPSPIGIGQSLLVNMWLVPPLESSRYHTDYTVTITKPDGTKDSVVMDSYRADTTAWFEYPVDQIGTWKLKFEFLGGYFPAGLYEAYRGERLPGEFLREVTYTNFTQSCYYEPSSTEEQTLTVQEDMVWSWPLGPLPTDYWTRPIAFEHREWWPIAGNYPWRGPGGGSTWNELYPGTNPRWSSNYAFTPWVQAPNTAHIVWKRVGAIGGIVGGDIKEFSLMSSGGNPSIIFEGMGYQTVTKPFNGVATSVWQCYDIRTGNIIWEQTGVPAPSVIEYDAGYAEVPGAESAIDKLSTNLVYIGGGRLIKYSPLTGAASVNVSIAPLSTGTCFMNGHALTVQDLGAAAGANRYRLINWTTFGTSSNFTQRIKSNTTYASNSLPSLIDWNAGLGASLGSTTSPATLVSTGTTITGYKLATGEKLWNITVDGDAQYSGSCAVADHGKVAYLVRGAGYFRAYDLASGNLAWKSEVMEYPWGAPSFGAYAIQSAYGMLFRDSYDGVYAFDWDTGKIVWRYVAQNNPFETPYTDEAGGQTVSSFNAGGIIADGKMYVHNTEHSATAPVTRGWQLHCINITTGEGIWKIKTPGSCVVADGYLSVSCSTGYQYVFGRGKSVTTVSASPKIIAKGATVLIEGTVTDQSPAQPGTPCVSKDSMTLQMEYLHLQMPIDGLWHNETITGVPVTLTAIGVDGSVIDLGTATTSGYYGTYEKAWTPPAEGTYKIIANFASADSYGSSAAATAVTVGPAPEPVTFPEQIAPADYTWTIIGIGIAIMVVVVIAVAIAVLILRKRV